MSSDLLIAVSVSYAWEISFGVTLRRQKPRGSQVEARWKPGGSQAEVVQQKDIEGVLGGSGGDVKTTEHKYQSYNLDGPLSHAHVHANNQARAVGSDVKAVDSQSAVRKIGSGSGSGQVGNRLGKPLINAERLRDKQKV